MIKRIRLHNIESHTDSALSLANSNAIIGSSSTGKSAVFRGLSSLLYFLPVNTRFAYRRAEVEVETDQHVIIRKRVDDIEWQCAACEKKYPKYTEQCTCGATNLRIKRSKELDLYTIDGTPFEKMGRGWKHLDENIKKTWPLAYFEFAPDKPFFPGFKSQFDQFIWDQLTAAELSYLFSFLEGLDYLEEMTKSVRSDLAITKKSIGFLEPEIELLEETVTETTKLFEFRRGNYEKKQAYLDELKLAGKKFYSVQRVFNSAYANRKATKRVNEKIAKCKPADTEALKQKIFKYQEMDKYARQLDAVTISLRFIEGELEKSDRSASVTKLVPLVERWRRMDGMICTIERLKLEIGLTETRIAEAEDELKEINVGIRKRFLDYDICPFTGWPISAECKKRMLDD